MSESMNEWMNKGVNEGVNNWMNDYNKRWQWKLKASIGDVIYHLRDIGYCS